MKKIPTIFKRNLVEHKLTDECNPDCLWVFKGEGMATRKWDGTCCLIMDGGLFKRREVKKGKPIPSLFVVIDFDEVTGKRVGWMPVTDEDKWHIEAFKPGQKDGTYELVGPKVQGNPEEFDSHTLISHADSYDYIEAPIYYNSLKAWLEPMNIEGLVWHHPDGRMAKIKKKDFGLKRP